MLFLRWAILKIAKTSPVIKIIFSDPSQKRKPSVQKVPLYTIYMEFYQLEI